jgi:hypothetical protein
MGETSDHRTVSKPLPCLIEANKHVSDGNTMGRAGVFALSRPTRGTGQLSPAMVVQAASNRLNAAPLNVIAPD